MHERAEAVVRFLTVSGLELLGPVRASFWLHRPQGLPVEWGGICFPTGRPTGRLMEPEVEMRLVGTGRPSRCVVLEIAERGVRFEGVGDPPVGLFKQPVQHADNRHQFPV